MDDRQRRYLLFFIGIALLTGGFILAIAALRYEFLLLRSSESAYGYLTYDAFSAAEQRVIRGAIDGQRYVFAAPTSLPSARSISYTGQLTVRYEGRFYTFRRGLFFAVRTWFGVAAIGLTAVGVVSTGTAVRRDMQAAHP